MTREEALNDIIENGINLCSGDYVSLEALKIAADALQEPERKKGQWKSDGIAIVCDQCGRFLIIEQGNVDMNYCPHCAADMRGEQE